MSLSKEEIDLRLAFYQLEKFYRPLFDLITEQQDKYREYKGSTTIDSYLCYRPDVLILGYNPGNGKYHDWNKEGAHLVYTGERPLGIFEWGNANKGAWYEMSKPVNNSYPKNILEFLYQYAELRKWCKEDKAFECPTWMDKAERKIMMMNLYPIGTKDGATLRLLFTKLINENRIPYVGKFSSEWDLRKFLLIKLHQFIEQYVKPKSILCLGKSTISDYTWNNYAESKYKSVFIGKNYTNVVGVSRSGTWTNRAKKAAFIINDILNR